MILHLHNLIFIGQRMFYKIGIRSPFLGRLCINCHIILPIHIFIAIDRGSFMLKLKVALFN